MWFRCNPPSKSIDGGEELISEAYYRESGDVEKGYKKLSLDYVVNQYEETIISDHSCAEYTKWMEMVAGGDDGDGVWPDDFL